MSTPTPVSTSPMTATLAMPVTAVVSSTPASPPSTKVSAAADVTAVSKTAATPADSLADSTPLTTVPPEASKGVSELIKELERKRLELETQINQLRAESVTSFPATHSPIAAAASSSPGISSTGISSIGISSRCSSNVSSRRAIPTPMPSLASLPTLPAVLQKLVGAGLNTPDLAHLCEQGRVFRTIHSPEMLERRRVTTDLLPHVFNADPVKVAAFFAIPGTQKRMVLTKTSYREGYHSKKENKFICFRHWTRVSPLQAAALSLDNFLVRDLLSHIENDATLRLQAAQQLQEILNRKEVKPKVENVSSVSYSSSSSSSSLMTREDKETKVKVENENKVRHEKATQAEADLSFYQAPFKALLKAYDDYITQYDTLWSAREHAELDRLWGTVGECHRRLPTYGLQEFCDNKPFYPLPLFTTPPHRGACRYYDESLLDLDGIGLKSGYGLYKAVGGAGLGRVRGVAPDSAAISRLCELRQAELENIIKCLLIPGATVTLRPDEDAIAAVKP